MNFLNNWLKDLIGGIVDTVIGWIPAVTTPTPYWEEPWAGRAREVIVMVAWTLLTLRVILEAWRLYIARDAGEAIISPGVLFRRAAYAAMFIPVTGWIVQWAVKLSTALAKAIVSVGGDVDVNAVLGGLFQAVFTQFAGGAFIAYAALLLALVGAFLLLAVQASIRGVELTIAFILGPGLAVSAAGSDDFLASGTAAVWWREVWVLALTQVVQTLLMMAILNYTLGTVFSIPGVLVSLAFAWVAIKSPSLLRSYAYSTGMGQMASHGAMAVAAKVLMKAPW